MKNTVQNQRAFSLLIKPSSADCNLKCDYCFYLKKSELYPNFNMHRMSLDTLENLVSSYMATHQPVYSFIWQGGEPLLMGLNFYKEAIKFQQKYCKPGSAVSNAIQTNGTLVDDSIAELFAKYNFLVGLSIDGSEESHNQFRSNHSGIGTYADVVNGIDVLKKHKVDFNAVTVVSSANVKRAKQTYQTIKELGINYHQYIPCVEYDNKGCLLPFSITGEDWGRFLCELFDEWYPNDCSKISVRLFDTIIELIVKGTRNTCQIAGNCRQYFVVEYNGDIYPCDFFVDKHLKLGNILDDTWDSLWKSRIFKAFGQRKSKWNDKCKNCDYLKTCKGDCPKHRFNHKDDLSCLCEGWTMFYNYAMPIIKRIAAKI